VIDPGPSATCSYSLKLEGIGEVPTKPAVVVLVDPCPAYPLHETTTTSKGAAETEQSAAARAVLRRSCHTMAATIHEARAKRVKATVPSCRPAD